MAEKAAETLAEGERRPAAREGARAPTLASDLQGLGQALVAGVVGASRVVEDMHGTIASIAPLLGDTRPGRTRGLTRLVYWNIRGVTQLVGLGVQAALQQLEPVLQQRTNTTAREDVVAALNGVVGAHLEATKNPLAIRMSLRQDGHTLDADAARRATGRFAARSHVVVLSHGSCMSDVAFTRDGHNHGYLLADLLDATPLYLHYNSGLAIPTNGHQLDALLESLQDWWPVPITDITMIGFSMGGLVFRSALHNADARGAVWPTRVRRLVTIGTPHHGAPLERVGHFVTRLLASTPYAAPIGRLATVRGPGVQDLRHGNITVADHAATAAGASRDVRELVPLPTSFPCYAIAGSRSSTLPPNPMEGSGDGMVPLTSALGIHETVARSLDFPVAHRAICAGCNHLDLLSSPAVADQLRTWFGPG